jgi:predicted Zn-dependent protease
LHFDDAEHFTDASYSGTNLLAVAVHEIGHVIGIGHSSEKKSVMNPMYTGYDPNLSLHADDINAAAYIYGKCRISRTVT